LNFRYLCISALLMAGTLPSFAAEQAAIEVNQVGFPPAAAKWAAVPATQATSFSVVDAKTGKQAWRGALGPAAAWAPAQETVRLADFSAFKTPGSYRLHVEGVADSAALRRKSFSSPTWSKSSTPPA